MKNHMTGILLVNLAIVGLITCVTDILIEIEAEVLAESNIKGKVTCHMIQVLSTVAACEFTLILLLLALDRILVTLDKVPYDNRKAFIAVSVLSWFISIILAVLGIYAVTGDAHAYVIPYDIMRGRKKTICWIGYGHASMKRHETYFGILNILFPVFGLIIASIILSIIWCYGARSGKSLSKNDKFLNISFFVSSLIFVLLTVIPKFYFRLGIISLLAIPVIMIPWLILVPELRSSLCGCQCIKDDGEGAMLLKEQEKPE